MAGGALTAGVVGAFAELGYSDTALVNSAITKEQFDALFDAINNNSGQIISDMLDQVQMPTGMGT